MSPAMPAWWAPPSCGAPSANGCEIITANRRELDLRHSEAVERFMAQAKPDAVFVAAGKVGGIGANSAFPADFPRRQSCDRVQYHSCRLSLWRAQTPLS